MMGIFHRDKSRLKVMFVGERFDLFRVIVGHHEIAFYVFAKPKERSVVELKIRV
jgi:hypothetical protein